MKKSEIMIQILHEATGKPLDEVRALWESSRADRPDDKIKDPELTDAEAEKLMAVLREENSGFLAWLTKGFMDVHRNQGNC